MLQNPTVRSIALPLILAVIALVILNVGLYTRLGAEPVVKPLPFPYREDFNDGEVLEQYARFSGSWDIRDRSLVQLSTTGFDLIALIPVKVPADQSYMYETRMRFISDKPGGGILFNAQQVTTRQQSHIARFNLDGDQLWLWYGYFGDDSIYREQGRVPVELDPNTKDWHLLAVRVEYNVYSLLLDNVVIVPNVPLLYHGGSVGALTAESQVAFDDISVQPIIVDAPAGGYLWRDDFDDTTSSQTLWLPISGTWEFREGELAQTQTDGYDLFAINQQAVPALYRLDVSLRHESGVGGGVVFNIQAPNTRDGGHLVRYYEDGLVWGHYDPENGFIGQGNMDVPAPATDVHQLSIIVFETAYTIYVDNNVVAENVPLLGNGRYVALTSSASAVAFESAEVRSMEPGATTIAAEPTQAPSVVEAEPVQVPETVVEIPVLTEDGLLWRDEFDNTAEGESAWLPISGTWEFREGELAQTQTDAYDLLAINQQAVTAPYRLDVRLRHENGVGGGVVFNLLQPDGRDGGHMVRYYEEGMVWGYFEPNGGFIGQGNAAVPAPATDLHLLSIVVADTTYTIYVDDQLVAENVPLLSDGRYVALSSSICAVAFESAEVRAMGPAATTLDGLDLNTISGQWVTEDGVTMQLDQEAIDYIAGTGVLAESFTVSVDILLPNDPNITDAGAGLVLHMAERENPANGSMVRFSNNASEIFWGVFDASGAFQGLGGRPLELDPSVAHTMAVTVGGGSYDIYVDGTLLIQDVPMTSTQGWIGLLSFRGPTAFSNLQLTIGE